MSGGYIPFSHREERQIKSMVRVYDFEQEYSFLEPYVRKLTNEDIGKRITKVQISYIGTIPDLSYTRRIHTLIDLNDSSFCGAEKQESSENYCCRYNCKYLCGKCKKMPYCDKKCQVLDWARHKENCGNESSNIYSQMTVLDYFGTKTHVSVLLSNGWIVLDELPEDVKLKLPDEIKI
jgi:hypothetical protein